MRAQTAMKIVAATVVTLAVGCAGEDTGTLKPRAAVRGMSKDDAALLNSERSNFGKGDDSPFNARTHFAAAQLAESQGNLQTAVEQYNAVLKLHPTHLSSLYRLGVLHAQAKQYPQAIAAWNEYLKHSQEDATGYANLGFCHELAGRPAEAEKAYQQGIRRDGGNNPCRVNYGLMLARLNRTNEAIVQLQAVLPPAQVYYNLASMHELQGRREEAKAAYREAVSLDPDLLEAKARLAGLETGSAF